jgi:hypothetical protein
MEFNETLSGWKHDIRERQRQGPSGCGVHLLAACGEDLL